MGRGKERQWHWPCLGEALLVPRSLTCIHLLLRDLGHQNLSGVKGKNGLIYSLVLMSREHYINIKSNCMEPVLGIKDLTSPRFLFSKAPTCFSYSLGYSFFSVGKWLPSTPPLSAAALTISRRIRNVQVGGPPNR